MWGSFRLTGSVEEQEKKGFYLEIRKLLTREPGAQSLPASCTGSPTTAHAGPPMRGRTLGFLEFSAASPTPCNSSLLRMPPEKLIGTGC